MTNVFGQGFITLDGELLAENVSFQTSLERTSTDVYSLTGNFEGVDIGPVMRSISAENVVGSGEVWKKVEKLYLEGSKAIAGVEDTSGNRFLSKGRFVSISRSCGVGQTSTVSFSFRGEPSQTV